MRSLAPSRSAVAALIARLLAGARSRLASEAGFAVPTVLLMTVAALGMAGVMVTTSIQGQSGTVRDQGGKTALAVAESGVNQALLYYNRGVAPCVPTTAEGWCGPVTGMSVNGGSVTYWARTLSSAEQCGVGNEVECVEIVSVGAVNGVTRRIDVMASTLPTEDSSTQGPFATAGVLSYEDMTLDSNASIHTGTATNGYLRLKSNAKQCGQASVGIGKKLETSSNAQYHSNSSCTSPSSTVLQQELTLPRVEQGDAATSNDNSRLFALDQISGKKGDACWNGKTGEEKATSACGTRELRVDNNSSVTLGGKIYSFCKLTLRSNSALYIESGANTTIYFDSPEACFQSSGVYQLDLQSNSRITSASGDPVTIAMLFVGSETKQTRILLNSNTSVDGPCEQNFVIYAPLSDVTLNSNSRFCGAIAGKTIHLDSNAEIWSAKGTGSFNLPGVELPETPAHYTPYRFVECSPAPAATPNDGC
jgi:hypothetical protein